MVVVDTAVWIDFFQNPAGVYNDTLARLVQGRNRAAICGLILQEILQGIKEPKSYTRTRQRLRLLPFLDTTREIYLLAAALYRDLRSAGVTVPPADATIAAVVIAHRVPLLTSDHHFTLIAAHSRLELFGYLE